MQQRQRQNGSTVVVPSVAAFEHDDDARCALLLREARGGLDRALLEHEQDEAARLFHGTVPTTRGQCVVYYGSVSTK